MVKLTSSASVLLASLLGGCGSDSRPPLAGDLGGDDDVADVPDASTGSQLIGDDEQGPGAGNCGETTVELDIKRPNFYFVLDSSESMLETMPGSGGVTRHLAARRAVADMLRAVGHRINYGAASFPEKGGCSAGAEVFPVREGDPRSEDGTDGPVLDGLVFTLRQQTPDGATPVAETIRELTPELSGLEGDTSVFLLTDGAPNCDETEPCTADSCIPNIEAIELEDGRVCGDQVDCCQPGLAPHLCLDDDDATSALAELAAGGVQTFVIGIPGSEVYADVLDAMAQAAGTAREGEETQYYQVDDAEELAITLSDLGERLSLTCEFDLGEQPERPDLVYVAAGEEVLEKGAKDGWQWQGDSVVLLTGQPCEDWKQGDTPKVQVFQGCPFTMK